MTPDLTPDGWIVRDLTDRTIAAGRNHERTEATARCRCAWAGARSTPHLSPRALPSSTRSTCPRPSSESMTTPARGDVTRRCASWAARRFGTARADAPHYTPVETDPRDGWAITVIGDATPASPDNRCIRCGTARESGS